MERINANEVQSMMEAYASIYNNQEQEVISEETQELEENRNQRGAAARANREAAAAAAAAQGNSGGPTSPSRGALSMQDRRFARRSSSATARANTNKAGQTFTPAQVAALKKAGEQKPAQSPSSNLKPGDPSTVVSPKSGEETKFERRLPSMAELRAAQAARKAAKSGGASDREAGYQAVKAGVGVSKGTVKDPKIAADAARKAELEAIRAKAKADTMKKKPAASAPAMSGRARMGEELDVFDTIKEYLIGEGATEDEALKAMTILTDEERTEILEGIIGQTADNIARTAGTVVGTVQRGAGYLKQKVSNVKGTFDAARERASSNNPDVRSGRMTRSRTPGGGGPSSVPPDVTKTKN